MLELKFGKTILEIHFLFIAVITLCFLLDGSGLMAFGLFAGLIHESGHLLALAATGGRPERLSFEMTGIRLEQNNFPLSPSKEALILVAGSGINFLTAVLIIISTGQISIFAGMNLFLGILNLLPIRAFDGGKLLELLFHLHMSVYYSEKLINIIQIVFIVLITVLCLFLFIVSLRNITMLLMCIYLWCSLLQG